MLRWGSGAVVAVLLIFLLFSAWVSYPDEVVTRVTVSAARPPVPIVNRVAGVVAEVFVSEGEAVEPNAPLLLLDNSARFADVQTLDAWLAALEDPEDPVDPARPDHPARLRLGELGADYARLVNLGAELDYWLARRRTSARARALTAQLRELQAARATLERQLDIQDDVLDLAEKRITALEEIAARQPLATNDLEITQAENDRLLARRGREEQLNRLNQSRGREAALRENLAALDEELDATIMEHRLAWRAQIRTLRQSRQAWEDKYLLRATAPGRVTFYLRPYRGLFVDAAAVVMGIVDTSAASTFVAVGELPQAAAGKIAVGAEAYLELEAYPAREYGRLPAVVKEIALSTTAGAGYRLVLELPEGTRTAYGRELPLRQAVTARAVLLSERRSLLGRLLDRLRSARYNG